MCFEAFGLVQCRIEVVFQLYLWFPGQFDFISLTIVIDGVLQNIKLFFLFYVNLLRVFLNAVCFNTPELLNKFVKSGFMCSVSWHMENEFLLLMIAGYWLVAEIQFSYSPARVQPSLDFTRNGWFWLPVITCLGEVNANALTPRRAPILPSAIFGKCMRRKLLKASQNWLSSKNFAAATFEDGVQTIFQLTQMELLWLAQQFLRGTYCSMYWEIVVVLTVDYHREAQKIQLWRPIRGWIGYRGLWGRRYRMI